MTGRTPKANHGRRPPRRTDATRCPHADAAGSRTAPERAAVTGPVGPSRPAGLRQGSPEFAARPAASLRQLSSSARARLRRGKQVPGCQSRTRPEQERTGLNRREQNPAGRRAPPPPARARRYTYDIRRARARAA